MRCWMMGSDDTCVLRPVSDDPVVLGAECCSSVVEEPFDGTAPASSSSCFQIMLAGFPFKSCLQHCSQLGLCGIVATLMLNSHSTVNPLILLQPSLNHVDR